MTNTNTLKYVLPDPLIQFSQAPRPELEVSGEFGIIKSPEEFPELFEYHKKSGDLLPLSSNVTNFVTHCLGLTPVYNTSLGLPEFLNLESGDRYFFNEVRAKVLEYFNLKHHRIVSNSFKLSFEAKAQRLPYSPFLTRGFRESWDGVGRVDPYIDQLKWNSKMEPPVLPKKDGTMMTGAEWKQFALRAWLVNCWLRTVGSVYQLDEVPETKMIILCSEGSEEPLCSWIHGLLKGEAWDDMCRTDVIKDDIRMTKTTTITPIFHFCNMSKVTKTMNRNSKLEDMLVRRYTCWREPYDYQPSQYLVTTSFIGTAVGFNPAKVANNSRNRVLLHIESPKEDEISKLNIPQFWAEVRHLAENAGPEEYSFKPFEASIRQYNKYA